MNATDMVRLIEDALSKNAGVAKVTVDGQTVEYDRQQAMQELDYWRRRAASEQGKRPLFRGFNLNSAW